MTEWELEDLQQTINQTISQNKIITLIMWESTKYVQWSGTIQTLNHDKRVLTLETIIKNKQIPIHTTHAACLMMNCKTIKAARFLSGFLLS